MSDEASAENPSPEEVPATPEPQAEAATPEPQDDAATPEPQAEAATPEPKAEAAMPEPQAEAAMPEPQAVAAPPPPASAPSPEEQMAPPAYAPPPGAPAPAARRGRGPIVAIALVIILVVLAVVGYAGVGYAYAQSRIGSARTAYNTAIDHANKYNDTISGLTSKMVNIDINTTATDLQNNKTLIAGLTASSQAAQTQIAADDASLSQAQSDLNQNSWLTAVSKSDIDRYTTKIGHLRDALASAKTITTDYVQFGTFYQAFYDVLLDLETLGSSTDATTALTAVTKIKTDSAKAISLDKAPGVAPEVGTFLTDVQKAATDLTALYAASATGDTAAYDAAKAAVDQDITKLDSDDLSAVPAKTDAFYKPLIDAYNSEIDAANKT